MSQNDHDPVNESFFSFQAIWKECFDTSSVGDPGTMYAAVITLMAKNVPTANPMKDINAVKVSVQFT